jgi:hypothetical protein
LENDSKKRQQFVRSLTATEVVTEDGIIFKMQSKSLYFEDESGIGE